MDLPFPSVGSQTAVSMPPSKNILVVKNASHLPSLQRRATFLALVDSLHAGLPQTLALQSQRLRSAVNEVCRGAQVFPRLPGSWAMGSQGNNVS